jgi:hypothetical protein
MPGLLHSCLEQKLYFITVADTLMSAMCLAHLQALLLLAVLLLLCCYTGCHGHWKQSVQPRPQNVFAD